MRLALPLFLLALAACDAGGPVVPGELPTLAPEQEAAAREDAAQLALRHQLAVARDSATVELPGDLVQGLYAALVRARASAAGGLVADVHTFPYLSTHEVMVTAVPGATWTAGWREGRALTGYAPVDSLVRRYGLTLRSFHDFSFGDTAVLRSETPLNTVALGRLFGRAPEVRSGSSHATGGDGDDIRAERLDGAWRLAFSVGSGDCPAGCTVRRTWTFRVSDGGEVAYLGARGGR